MSELESKLRHAFDIPESDIEPHLRIRHLGAFWPHWNLHKRVCDKTGKDIISVFSPECPYPIWHKDEWYKSALPPSAQIDFLTSRFFLKPNHSLRSVLFLIILGGIMRIVNIRMTGGIVEIAIFLIVVFVVKRAGIRIVF